MDSRSLVGVKTLYPGGHDALKVAHYSLEQTAREIESFVSRWLLHAVRALRTCLLFTLACHSGRRL